MTYRVILARTAERDLRKSDPQVRRRLQAAIELLAGSPRPPTAILLVGGSGEWRVRMGDYRITHEIHDEEIFVLVLRAGHRREIYRPD